ncbi:MAG: hypothetical protein KJP11_00225 [Gammaproteobacteria bacterium]|nr:hypothetical protein [Gammaproteobacteria bacterium]
MSGFIGCFDRLEKHRWVCLLMFCHASRARHIPLTVIRYRAGIKREDPPRLPLFNPLSPDPEA